MQNEEIRDTLIDIAGYSFIGSMMEDDKWNDSSNGVKNVNNFDEFFDEVKELFYSKLESYGTKDLQDVKQISQRIIEKCHRMINLKGKEKTKEPEILVRLKSPDHVGILPPKLPGDVGMDLVCSETTTIPPNTNTKSAVIIPAGVYLKAPDGYYCEITGRSSAAKRGLSVQTATIDNGYTGEMFSCVWNPTSEPITVEKGERIAQVVFKPICVFPIKFVDELPGTERGDKGFGSTGIF